MPPPMQRARRSLVVRATSSAPTLSTPLVATLTAAAAGHPPSLAATAIAPPLCCECGRDVCAVRVYTGGQHLRKSTPFLERSKSVEYCK